MKNYNFNELLSPPDFELLSRDLLQRELNLTFESFADGRDGGIDFLYSKNLDSNDIILQCKNRKGTFSNLFSELTNEVKKVKKLEPKRYILTTNLDITPLNKEKIIDLFSPYILNSSDIYDNKDLNNILSLNPDIEKKYYKLWLPNIGILEHVMHNNIYCQSESLLEEIENEAKYFVYNKTFDIAINILAQYKYCIISGNPGVGKTTLAKMLLLHYLLENKGFEIHEVKNIEQIKSVWKQDIQQIFFFDDFLGRNIRKVKLSKNEDANIIQIIKRVTRYDNKYIIFTTREYIINQAKSDYDMISNSQLNLARMIIDIGKYTNTIKAQILYNHLFFSFLNQDFINQLLINNRYLEIIYHKNYNPRIIEHLTKKEILLDTVHISSEDYFEYFLENLNNPIKIWADIFENDKISYESKALLFCLFIENANDFLTFGDFRFLNSVREIFDKLYEYYIKERFIFKRELPFEYALKELDNSFIKLDKDEEIEFYDPSINDYLFKYLRDNDEVLLNIIRGTKLFSSRMMSIVLKNIFDFQMLDNRLIPFSKKFQLEFVRQLATRERAFNFDDISFLFELLELDCFAIDTKVIEKIVKKFTKKIDIYKGHNNLKKFINSDDLYNDPYYISDILEYYKISKKYNIKKYNIQDLYDYCIEILFYASSNYDNFYTFADICFLPGIKRDKKEELSAINSAISDAFVDIYEIDELENLSECIYDLESIFDLDNFDDKIEDTMIRIKNKKLNNINKIVEDDNINIDNPMEEKEIQSLYNTLKQGKSYYFKSP